MAWARHAMCESALNVTSPADHLSRVKFNTRDVLKMLFSVSKFRQILRMDGHMFLTVVDKTTYLYVHEKPMIFRK